MGGTKIDAIQAFINQINLSENKFETLGVHCPHFMIYAPYGKSTRKIVIGSYTIVGNPIVG